MYSCKLQGILYPISDLPFAIISRSTKSLNYSNRFCRQMLKICTTLLSQLSFLLTPSPLTPHHTQKLSSTSPTQPTRDLTISFRPSRSLPHKVTNHLKRPRCLLPISTSLLLFLPPLFPLRHTDPPRPPRPTNQYLHIRLPGSSLSLGPNHPYGAHKQFTG